VREEQAFDRYAQSYDADLARALSVSGEDKQYFAHGRIDWLAQCLRTRHDKPKSVMDFGCGTGSATPYLRDLLGAESILGIDISSKSLDVAQRTYGSERARFMLLDQYHPIEQIDLVFSNGAFHHIPPNNRASAVNYIFRSLRPGGLLALWENNPWNPGTRYVMSQCPFDWDAITLTSRETRRMLQNGGFDILRTDFLFIFPRIFSWFRGIESFISRLPLGAQYQVLCQKT
jgi:SAM-dependent methyltransferase